MNKNNIIYKVICWYIPVILVFIIVSCSHEVEDSAPGQEKEERVTLKILSGNEEYQQPTLRTVGEFDVNTLTVLVFRTSDGGFLEVAEGKMLTATHGTVSLIKRTHECILLLISNIRNTQNVLYGVAEEPFSREKIEEHLSGKTLTEAVNMLYTKKLDIPYIGMPFDGPKVGIPMAILTNVSSIEEGTTIGAAGSTLKLQRVAARIEIRNPFTNKNFELLGAAPYNVARNGLIWNMNSIIPDNMDNLTWYESESDDKLEGLVKININNASGYYYTDPIFVYETHADNDPAIILKGRYNGEIYYYKFQFYSNNATPSSRRKFSIERNKYYSITITQAIGPGYRTLEDAKNHPPGNFVNIDIINIGQYESVSSGNYLMGLSNSEYIFYNGGTITRNLATFYNDIPLSTSLTINSVISKTEGIVPRQSYQNDAELLSELKLNGTTAIYATIPSNLSEGIIELRLMNVTKEINIIRQPGIPASGGDRIAPGDNFLSAEVEENSRNWLSLSFDGIHYFSEKVLSDTPESLYIKIAPNTTSSSRTGYIYGTKKVDGRIKRVQIAITQSGS